MARGRANRRRNKPSAAGPKVVRRSSAGKQKQAQRVARIREHVKAGRFEEARESALSFLQNQSEHADAWYCLAVSQRYLGLPRDALESLDRLEQLQPNNARLWQERGHLARDYGNAEAAIAAYLRAVKLNSALHASWRELARLASEAGKSELAQEATTQYDFVTSLPAELVNVLSYLNTGRSFRAEQLCRNFLKRYPKHVEGMRLLATIAQNQGILDDAEFILESALDFEPDHRGARLDYIDVLNKRQKYKHSREQALLLLKEEPDDPVYRLAYANQAMAIGDFDEAIEIYDEINDSRDRLPIAQSDLQLTRGHALKTQGRLDAAIDAYRNAYGIRPDFGDAYWSLANLKTYEFTSTELARLHDLAQSPHTPEIDRIHVLFALGKAYEDQAEYKTSFEFYDQGNDLQRQEVNYDSKAMTQRMSLQQVICTNEFLEQRSGKGCPDNDPIFVVGLPRAGSTLIEQILASHSQIDGTLELNHISAYALKLDGKRRVGEPPKYPARMKQLSDYLLRELGERYIEDTRIHRQQAPFFVDKMPNNFRHVGLIHLILPNAKIIDIRRHPMACCFSGFKQLFASGQEFTYGLREIGTYYKDYVELMNHWDSVLPGKVLRVHYEDVIEDLETQVRRILAYCGLPFEESCLRFFETERSIRTPSSEQVRQPIYRGGLEQWVNYEPWLGSLKATLGTSLTSYPL